MKGVDKMEAFEKSLEDWLNDMPILVISVADTLREKMADLNREQLMEGIRSDGSRIEPPYTPFTVQKKREKGQPTNKVTLFDTGDYQGRIKYKRFSNILEGQSDDWKDEHLQMKYGEKILGLTDENLQIIRDEMLPVLIEESRKKALP